MHQDRNRERRQAGQKGRHQKSQGIHRVRLSS
jgi:hypothetical protein